MFQLENIIIRLAVFQESWSLAALIKRNQWNLIKEKELNIKANMFEEK